MAYEDFQNWCETPLRETPRLSVVIPAYDESERILPTIGAIANHVSESGPDWELIVSDDGSTDGTPDLVSGLAIPNLRLLEAPANQGKGAAVRRGMLATRGRRVLFADADQSTPIEQLEALDGALDRGADLAIASRAAAGAVESSRTPLRRMMSGGLRMIVRRSIGVAVDDSQCGFKLFDGEVARRLFAGQTMPGFSFDLEILFLAHRLGYRIEEVPVRWIDAPGSKVDPIAEAKRFLVDLARIRRNGSKAVYDGV